MPDDDQRRALTAGVLVAAGFEVPHPMDLDVPLATLAGSEVRLLRLLCAADDAVDGGFPTELLDVVVTLDDLVQWIAVRHAHQPAGRR